MDLESFKHISNFDSEKHNILIDVKGIRCIVEKLCKGFKHEFEPYICMKQDFRQTQKWQSGGFKVQQ